LNLALGISRTRQVLFFGKCISSSLADVNHKYVFSVADGFSDEAEARPDEERGTDYQTGVIVSYAFIATLNKIVIDIVAEESDVWFQNAAAIRTIADLESFNLFRC